MKFKFSKNLDYQLEAINSIVNIFDTGKNLEKGNEENFALMNENQINVVANELEIDNQKIVENLKNIQKKNGIVGDYIDEKHLEDFSIEMETGTGKTYVYLRTIFELNKKYNLKKFIILVPSVAIREGVLKSIEQMREHFKNIYEVNFKGFAYDSDKLNEVRDFVQVNNLVVMIMTVQSFKTDTTVMKQSPDRFNGNRPIDLVAATKPIIIMDEPQNMESDQTKEAIKDLNPLFKLRYSATHRDVYNLVYRLTPVDAYKKSLVKKIEIFGIKEENSNSFLFKVKEIIIKRGELPKAKVIVSTKNADGLYSDKEIIIRAGDRLDRKTGNEMYKDLFIVDVNATYKRVELSNNNYFKLEEVNENKEDIFRVQIRETIRTHFDKQVKLKDQNIKVLSLFFIDKVNNYTHIDSMIRNIFNQEFENLKKNYEDFKNLKAEDVHKGYFASKKVRGNIEVKDSVSGTSKEDKETYDLIMKDKEKLLSFTEKVSFIFSHSALREGWDNPNIFQICTLRETNSVISKRQEVGRGLRLPVNQNGERIYNTDINILTVIPNESYRDFCTTYQAELTDSGYIGIEPGNAREKTEIKLNNHFNSEEFKELWQKISKRTKYNLEIQTDNFIEKNINEINSLNINSPQIKIEGAVIYFDKNNEIETTITTNRTGGIVKHNNLQINNFLERIARDTNITKDTIYKIFVKINNLDYLFDNYEEYIRSVILIIQKNKNNLLINDGLKYFPTGEVWEANLLYKDIQEVFANKSIEVTKSVTNKIVFDGEGERRFAISLDNNPNVKIFTKLPRGFKVNTPLGDYIPDWAIVYDKDGNNKLYLVRETKFYNGNILEEVLTQEEIGKIKCAEKHFKIIDIDYKVVQGLNLNDLL